MTRRTWRVAALLVLVALWVADARADSGLIVRGTHAVTGTPYRVAAHAGTTDVAIVTTDTGTVFVDVTDPTSPSEMVFIPGPAAAERVAAVVNGHAYLANDASGGIRIVDLSAGPPAVVGTIAGIATATVLAPDTTASRLYVAGTASGLHVFDVSAPAAPAPLLPTPFDTFPVSEVSIRFGWVYASTGSALAILNASLLPSLNLFAWINHADATTLTARLTDDVATAIAFDATGTSGVIRTLDVFDPRRAVSLGVASHADVPTAFPAALDHRGDALFAAWRNGGLEVRDLSDRLGLPRVASFGTDAALDVVDVDASLGTDRVLCLSAGGILTILELQTGNGRLEGVVTDAGSQTGERGVVVTIDGSGQRTESDGQGDYHLNVPPGAVTVTFERFGFVSQTLPAAIASGETTTLDVTMVREPFGYLQGTAFQSGRADEGRHPEGTIVRLLDTPLSTGAPLSGDYLLPDIPAGTYVAEADRFGYDTVQAVVTITAGAVTQRDFLLPTALVADNFETDSGWTTGDPNDTATTGRWVRDVPVGTGAGYVQPLRDETPDPANTALFTANGPAGGWIGDADVDGGVTIATSPAYDLTSVAVPILRFYLWLSVDGTWQGEAPGGDDRLVVDASNDGGAAWVTLTTVRDAQLFWRQYDFVLEDHLSATNDVRLRFRVFDEDPPSIVEAAVDDVELFSGFQMIELPHQTPILPDPGPAPPVPRPPLSVHPNPASTVATLSYSLATPAPVTIDVFDVAGRRVSRLVHAETVAGARDVTWRLVDERGRPVPSGVYWYRLSTPHVTITNRLLVAR